MNDWATEETIYQLEYFSLYCFVVLALIVLAWEAVLLIDNTLRK